MTLITTVTAHDMKRDMIQAGRDNFTIKAIERIIDFCNEFEETQEFYPVDIDCTFAEFDLTNKKDIATFINDYGYLVEDEKFCVLAERLTAIIEALEENTMVLCSDMDCVLFDYNF